jgi:hypothetical protein
MSLIKCPGCKKEISNTVETCPNCGYEIKSNINKNKIVTIQKTSKKIKLNMLISIILFFASSIVGFIRVANNNNPYFWFSISIIALLWLIATNIFKWWYHG